MAVRAMTNLKLHKLLYRAHSTCCHLQQVTDHRPISWAKTEKAADEAKAQSGGRREEGFDGEEDK